MKAELHLSSHCTLYIIRVLNILENILDFWGGTNANSVLSVHTHSQIGFFIYIKHIQSLSSSILTKLHVK